MNKFIISIIILTIYTFLTVQRGINCENQISKRYALRKLGIKFGGLAEMQFAETLQQKINLELENLEQIMRNEKKLIEEAKRRRVYEKYLLKFQGASSVLRDFHTNLF